MSIHWSFSVTHKVIFYRVLLSYPSSNVITANNVPSKVLKRLPNVAKIDGDMVKPTERELAAGIAAT
jgi:hypothetical protein